jgi:16S rRNA (guanine966-N2)-methyltransferase
MRIVGGEHRGRALAAPEGLCTRPTSDRVRESVFNVLQHAKWLDAALPEDAHVLDVFAGTGALGLEALSRGASGVVFMENDRAALGALRKNIETLGVTAKVLACDALAPPEGTPCGLVFLDPPYGKGLSMRALVALADKGWLAPDAVCVMEMSKKAPEDFPAGFTLKDERRYGVALVRFGIFKGF